MNPEILETLVGAVVSVLAAGLLNTRKKGSFLSFLALGLAGTALYVAVVPSGPSGVGDANPPFRFLRTTVVAHTGDRAHQEKDWPLPTYVAPSVPDPVATVELASLQCEPPEKAIAAWSEVVAAHPNTDTIYRSEARVDNNKIWLSLRSRQGTKGHAYINVLAVCSQR
ncbi:MAG: hypothetical protein OXE58_13220 [Acidobacteria bacterium]|nr:hypothetical protein [Acidobacteriota bacterium]